MENNDDPVAMSSTSPPQNTESIMSDSVLTKQPTLDESSSSTEEVSSSANSGSWSWGSFLQKATTDIVGKSAAMVEFMKRDLAEFSSTMQKDTAIIVNDATQSLKDKITMEEASKAAEIVKTGISSFFGSLNASLSLFDENAPAGSHDQQSRFQSRLSAIQQDPSTFQKEPSGRPEDFEAWLLMFDINKEKTEIERLLDSVESIQRFYNQFVPSVTHNEFWQRYFYRVYQLQKEEKRLQSQGEKTPDDMDWDGVTPDTGAASPCVLYDPSEVCSVVSNESFQMVSHEPVVEHDMGDTVLVGSAQHSPSRTSTGHRKKGALDGLP